MSFPNWGDVPAWATAGVALAAFVGAVMAYRDQSASLKIQRAQLDDQQEANRKQAEIVDVQIKALQASIQGLEQEQKERRRMQARQILLRVLREKDSDIPDTAASRWKMTATARNTGQRPVYDLHFIWRIGNMQLGQTGSLENLMPNDEAAVEQDIEIPPGQEVPRDGRTISAIAYFYDDDNVQWRVRPDGAVEEVPKGEGFPRTSF